MCMLQQKYFIIIKYLADISIETKCNHNICLHCLLKLTKKRMSHVSM